MYVDICILFGCVSLFSPPPSVPKWVVSRLEDACLLPTNQINVHRMFRGFQQNPNSFNFDIRNNVM